VPTDEAVEALEALLGAIGRGSARALQVGLGYARFCMELDDRARRVALRMTAEAMGCQRVAATLTDAVPSKYLGQHGRMPETGLGRASWFLQTRAPNLFARDEEERDAAHYVQAIKFLAQFNERFLDQMAVHPDPRVRRRLMRSVSLSEKQAVRIAAARPTTPALTQEILAVPRWFDNRAVREAVVRNPFTPPRIAAPLLVTLSHSAWRDLGRLGSVHPKLRQLARDLANPEPTPPE